MKNKHIEKIFIISSLIMMGIIFLFTNSNKELHLKNVIICLIILLIFIILVSLIFMFINHISKKSVKNQIIEKWINDLDFHDVNSNSKKTTKTLELKIEKDNKEIGNIKVTVNVDEKK